ncbi:MAG: sensor histidine kinase [Bacillota bacterium]
MPLEFRNQRQWVFCVAALAAWVAIAWPVFQKFATGGTIRDTIVSPLWFVPFGLFGAAVLAAMAVRLPAAVRWALLCVQVAAVAAMALILPWAGMSEFLIITAWQVAMLTSPARSLAWLAFQTLAVVAALAQSLNPDLCWVIGKAFALQLVLAFTAHALRREAETSRALAQANRELRSAQAIIARNVRDSERLRISRELHDAWGHELTALRLQLEIASHLPEPGRADRHVAQAKELATALLPKVRDVVATLREAERSDLKDALEALARSVPAPAIHVEIAPGLQVGADQAHALLRCAQEAVTNAVKHASASNLWLRLSADGDGVRLVARDDGTAPAAPSSGGSGLVGMRERLEALGGKLVVRWGAASGFTVDAWLPSVRRQPA